MKTSGKAGSHHSPTPHVPWSRGGRLLGPTVAGLSLLLSGLGVGGVGGLVGCASAPVPTQRVAAAQGAIRAAEELGAPDTPMAAFHLELAREQFVKANRLIEDKENDRAKYVLARAEADAELALMLSREEKMRSEAQDILNRVQQQQQRQQLQMQQQQEQRQQ